MKKLGIIGGLGPMATVYFMQLVTEMTKARRDQEHLEMILHSCPQIPDRTSYILGKSGENPFPALARFGKELMGQGADVIAIPCVTAHYFQRKLEEEIEIPILNAVEETAVCLEEAGVTRAGILATDGTLKSGLFQKAFEKRGIAGLLPGAEGQKRVMHLIYDNVKAGKPVELPLFEAAAGELFARGAQAVLLGCTELSLIKRDYQTGPGILDVMEVLARKAVLSCGCLKETYETLIPSVDKGPWALSTGF